MKKIKVGFIGLGLMGLPMAKNILKKKYPLIAWSRSKKNYKKIQKLGAKTCQDLINLPAKCQVIIMMLVDDKVCMQISNKLKNKLKKGQILIDMSSTKKKTVEMVVVSPVKEQSSSPCSWPTSETTRTTYRNMP